jgi:hypothetical protein
VKGFKFVRVYESGAEEELPEEVVREAFNAIEGGGLLTTTMDILPDGRARAAAPSEVYAAPSQIMAMIHYLSNLPQYRGARLDAIEVGTPH